MQLTRAFRSAYSKIRGGLADTFGLGPAVAISVLVFSALVFVLAVFWFFHSAPPKSIIITSGEEGSLSQRVASRYAKILAREGVKLKILPSGGSRENLARLENPSFRVHIGFVQNGLAKGRNIDNLVSLGSVSCQPLFIFYRSSRPVTLLSEFKGKRLAISREGTGAKVLALELLAMNGIKPGESTQLLEMDDEAAEKALLEKRIDAAFMMSDSASLQIMGALLRAPGIRLFDFVQADAYTRRIPYLNKIILLEGTVDVGKNIPGRDVHLLGPTVELVAREDLHPALSDLLIETAKEVHSRAGMFQRRGEYPALLENEFRISDDAERYYKSGKTFLYRYLPFWLASLINRIIVVFVPMVLLLIPGFRIIPSLYRWRIRLRILRWYRALLALEAELGIEISAADREQFLGRLDRIEDAVNGLKMPASFANEFYSLRFHIDFVRERLKSHKSGDR